MCFVFVGPVLESLYPTNPAAVDAEIVSSFATRKASVSRSGLQLEPDARSMNWSMLEEAVRACLFSAANPFSIFFASWFTCSTMRKTVGRQRDIFPIAPVREWDFHSELTCPHSFANLLLNACVAALNFLAMDLKLSRVAYPPCPRHTSAQVAVIDHVARRVARFATTLKMGWRGCFSCKSAFGEFEGEADGKYPVLQADAVDLPVRAGTCEPSELIPAELFAAVSHPENIFAGDTKLDYSPPARSRDRRDEYVKLVAQQLDCGKTRLHQSVRAVGDVFAVSKKEGRQREVWNGSSVSACAAKPPAPLFLANPSCFVDLVFDGAEEVFMSKRDVHTCFDVLKAPTAMQSWFGRPPVSLRELSLVSGKSADHFRDYVVDNKAQRTALHPDAMLFPASTVWPMGFSWSSCIAQACTVACCLEAGVAEENFLSMDVPPSNGVEACGVATDDTFFIHKDRLLGAQRLQRLDAAMEKHGMPKNCSKDVTLEASMTALGCELSSRPGAVEPSASKLAPLFAALLDVTVRKRASPWGMNRALGVEQWFCLLSRPFFSVFNEVYDFVRREPPREQCTVPPSVCAELSVATFLMPLLGADLTRQFLPFLVASDASPDFGFGVCFMECSKSIAEQVGALAERRGDFVKFYPGPNEPEREDRMGTPHLLPFEQRQFRIAISSRAQHKAHSSALEAHAVLLALKWVLRKASNFHHRLALLVDAKAVLARCSEQRFFLLLANTQPSVSGSFVDFPANQLLARCQWVGLCLQPSWLFFSDAIQDPHGGHGGSLLRVAAHEGPNPVCRADSVPVVATVRKQCAMDCLAAAVQWLCQCQFASLPAPARPEEFFETAPDVEDKESDEEEEFGPFQGAPCQSEDMLSPTSIASEETEECVEIGDSAQKIHSSPSKPKLQKPRSFVSEETEMGYEALSREDLQPFDASWKVPTSPSSTGDESDMEYEDPSEEDSLLRDEHRPADNLQQFPWGFGVSGQRPKSPAPAEEADLDQVCGTAVVLNIYDVTQSTGVQWFNTLFAYEHAPVKVVGFFHVGVQIGDEEWAFGATLSGSGVCRHQPRGAEQHHFSQSLLVGSTMLSKQELEVLYKQLERTWFGRDYHLLCNNCIDFAQQVCELLKVADVPAWLNRPAKLCSSIAQAAGRRLPERPKRPQYLSATDCTLTWRYPVIWGSQDTLTPITGAVGAYFTRLAKERDNVDFEIIPAGHIPHDENPEAVNKGGSSVQAVITNREQLIETRGPQDRAYAVLHGDGTVRCGGSPEFGGDCSGVQAFLHDVQAIHSTRSFFVALRHDGYLVTWGRDYYEDDHILEDIAHLWCLVQSIATADRAVAALLKDGSVVCWGDAEERGDCQAVERQLRRSGRSVTHIRGSSAGFGAVCSDGSVVTWGRASATLPNRLRHARNVVQLEATEEAFAVRLRDGAVVAWGDPEFGGDCSSVGPGIVQIVAGTAAFAALCQDGSVVSWGDPFRGGNRRLYTGVREIAAQHRGEVGGMRSARSGNFETRQTSADPGKVPGIVAAFCRGPVQSGLLLLLWLQHALDGP
ncbi:unnamed protein product [Symbiodinium sp. KB8]|nr:unnamed protein product [Symbiodinium sp. KB8]